MAKILFAIAADGVGHLNPSFQLAKGLVARGHSVRYVGLPYAAEIVRAEGFEYLPILDELVPKPDPPGTRPSLAKQLLRQRTFWRGVSRHLLEVEKFERLFTELGPEVCVVDADMAYIALYFYKLKIPVVIFNTSLPRSMDSYAPPVTTSLIPSDSWPSRLRTRQAWLKVLVRKRATAALLGLAGFPNATDMTKALARRCGYPVSDVEGWTDAESPRLRLPELVAAPVEFDFPRADRSPLRHYLGPMIDLGRKQADFPWERIDPQKKLIFCSLGSRSDLFAGRRAFYEKVSSMVAARSGWQLVIAVGPRAKLESVRMPENVIVVAKAPQLAMLERASLMITHGGLNSVKESIFFGVPMIVCPFANDMEGNAARVVHHGLGLSADIRKITEAELGRLMTRILEEPSFLERARAMSAIFKARQNAPIGEELIESMLPAGGRGQPLTALTSS